MNPIFIFVRLKIICGEYEFHSFHVEQIDMVGFNTTNPDMAVRTYAEEYAAKFYGGKSYTMDQQDQHIYYFHAGEVAVTVFEARLITSQDYIILKKYL